MMKNEWEMSPIVRRARSKASFWLGSSRTSAAALAVDVEVEAAGRVGASSSTKAPAEASALEPPTELASLACSSRYRPSTADKAESSGDSCVLRN